MAMAIATTKPMLRIGNASFSNAAFHMSSEGWSARQGALEDRSVEAWGSRGALVGLWQLLTLRHARQTGSARTSSAALGVGNTRRR